MVHSVLLGIDLALLQQRDPLGSDMRLPSRRTDVLRSVRVREELFHFFKRLASRLREHEEHMNPHGNAENPEKDIGLPFDVLERRRHEIAKREIERPIARCSQRHRFAADTERVQLRRVDPTYGSPSWRVGGDEEVAACDQALGGGAGNFPGGFGGLPADTAGTRIVAVGFEDTGIGKKPGHHEGSADQQSWSATPAIDEKKGRDRHYDVDHVLDRGGEKEIVLREAGHGEDKSDVVH